MKINILFDLILNAFWWKSKLSRKISLSKLYNKDKQKSSDKTTFEIFVQHYHKRFYSPILIFENFLIFVIKLNCARFHRVHVHFVWIFIVEAQISWKKKIVQQTRFQHFSTSLLNFPRVLRIYNYLKNFTLAFALFNISPLKN